MLIVASIVKKGVLVLAHAVLIRADFPILKIERKGRRERGRKKGGNGKRENGQF